MQSTISRRFLVCAAAVLGTTLVPWAVYHKGLGQTYEMKFGLDLKGGASITYRVRAEEGQDQAAILKDAIRVTQFRVDKYGVSEVNIVESGKDQFTVELPGRGKEEIDRIKSLMNQVGSLEFRIVAEEAKVRSEKAKKEREKEKYVPDPGFLWVPYEQGGAEALLDAPDLRAKDDLRRARESLAEAEKEGKAEVVSQRREKVADAEKALEDARAKFWWTGEHLETVAAEKAPVMEGSGYEVHFSIIPSRKSAFGDFTGNAVEKGGIDKAQMAIVLNGKIHTAPTLGSKLPGAGKIYSKANPYTQDQAQVLATVLQSGSLKVKPEEVSSFVVGPGLGEDAVRRGTWAIAVSTLLVIATMAFYYSGAGWVANFAVVLNLVMTLGILLFLGAALSLPGIAGLVLTLGMAVDANILVNERIREEKAAGKALYQAVAAGYERAFTTILDSNLTTIITAAILYWIGSGPIRGFALTLILGLVISMFTALYVTRTLFLWGMDVGILTEFRMMKISWEPRVQWMEGRQRFFMASLPLIVLGTAAWIARSPDSKYDLEFTGGQRVMMSLKRKLTIADVKDRLAKVGLPEVGVRTIKSRGSDSEQLDMSVESSAFEITARIKDEKEGLEFQEKVGEAFRADLVPHAIEEFKVEAKGADSRSSFRFVANFETESVTEALAKEIMSAAPLLKAAEDLKVEPGEKRPGTASFVVTGKVPSVEEGDLQLTLATQVRAAVKAHPGVELSDPVPQSDFIGPGVARTLRDQAVIAVLLSIIAQVVYLRFRFRDFTYGVAAAIALVHDVLITLGAVAVFDGIGLVNVKINLPVIASFLTLVGYSMNDTIVVFDRIRENLGRSVHPSSGLIDTAINQTLARSIRTSLTVFLVVLALFVINFGAASSLEGFAFVMVVGSITGVYSSVAIAAPLLLFLPVYGAELRRLGNGPSYALFASLAGGLGLAIGTDGGVALAGALVACALPVHFLIHLVKWLPKGDPDRLVQESERVAVAA